MRIVPVIGVILCSASLVACAPSTATTSVHAPADDPARALPVPPPFVTESPGFTCVLPAWPENVASDCKLGREASVYFAFGRADISAPDRDMLAAVAKCVTRAEGIIGTIGIEVTGRADPRGETEYNMALGSQRAEAVTRFLASLGVSPKRLRATSRGELDASGTDESSWARDRNATLDFGTFVFDRQRAAAEGDDASRSHERITEPSGSP